MKNIIIFLFLIPIYSNAQSLKCEQLTKDITYLDSIRLELRNEYNKDLHISFSIEKQLENEWILYSEDVFREPFNKVRSILTLKSLEKKTITFLLKLPEYFVQTKDGQIAPTSEDSEKTGTFRVTVNYGFDLEKLDQNTLLSNFKIAAP